MSVSRKGENLVFLLSLPRSGSTLLSLMLDRHPDLHCPQEPWILFSLLSARYRQTLDDIEYDAALATKLLLPEDEFLELCGDFAAGAYSRCLRARGRRIFVDKTPLYAWYLGQIHEMFPEAAYLWLKRDPFDVAASYQSHWYTPPTELVNHPHDLRRCCANLVDLFDAKPKRALEISYETLAADPEPTLRQVCDFVGVSFRPEMLNYDTVAAAGLVLGDNKAKEHNQAHTGSIGVWKEVLDPGHRGMLREYFGERMLERMGHDNGFDGEAGYSGGSRSGEIAVRGRSDPPSDGQEKESEFSLPEALGMRPCRHARWGFAYLHEAYVRLYWRHLGAQYKTVCLFGGGRYCQWLLHTIGEVAGGPRITMVFDDAATKNQSLGGVPVVRPTEEAAAAAEAVVLATDQVRSPLHERARQLFGRRQVVNLYRGLAGTPYPKGRNLER